MPIQLTTRCLRVEGVIGDIRRQVNVVREINLPLAGPIYRAWIQRSRIRNIRLFQ